MTPDERAAYLILKDIKAPYSQKKRWKKFLEGIWQTSPHNKDRAIASGVEIIIKELNK